jgi:ubiquinone/menaquinone biosynthesis C-methylase UbiE
LPKKFASFLNGKMVKDVLDIGCGYGRASFFLHENHYGVVGVDIDKMQIKLALKDANARDISGELSFLVGDARCLCFRNSSFDAILMLGILTLASKSSRTRIMSEAGRVLKPLGYAFIEEFGQTWENPIYSKRYKEDLAVTGELGTFTVKDENGKVLHLAHHFTREELLTFLRTFNVISFEETTFTSYYHRNWVKGYVIIAQKAN